MIIFTLGSVGSASTWMFNACRFLLRTGHERSVSLYAERAVDFLAGLPIGSKTVVTKCHAIDNACLVLVGLADSRIIVTLRDPKDSIASNIERFGESFQAILSSVSHSYATIASLPEGIQPLVFRYEDGPTAKIETVRRIADYIGAQATESELESFLLGHQPEALRERIAGWSNAAQGEMTRERARDEFDRQSHWHPGHLGDGLSGKWRRHMTEGQGAAVDASLPADPTDSTWRLKPLRWSSSLFRYADGQTSSETDPVVVKLNTRDIAVFGPYLHLPRGKWRVEADITTCNGERAVFTLDVYAMQRGLIALQTFHLTAEREQTVALSFDHHDHGHTLEVRIQSAMPNIVGVAVEFGGVTLTWVGPSEGTSDLTARELG